MQQSDGKGRAWKPGAQAPGQAAGVPGAAGSLPGAGVGLPGQRPRSEGRVTSQEAETQAHVLLENFIHHLVAPRRLLRPWDSPGKHTGMGCHFLLQGIFLTQGANPHISAISCISRQVLYHQCHREAVHGVTKRWTRLRTNTTEEAAGEKSGWKVPAHPAWPGASGQDPSWGSHVGGSRLCAFHPQSPPSYFTSYPSHGSQHDH